MAIKKRTKKKPLKQNNIVPKIDVYEFKLKLLLSKKYAPMKL